MDRHPSAFDLPIRIAYIPPAWLPAFILISHVGAVFCTIYSGLPISIKFLLILPVLAGLVWSVRYYTRGSRAGAPSLIILDARDRWLFVDANARVKYLRLVMASIPLPGLILLRLVDRQARKYDFILTENTADKTTLRRLRVRLLIPKSGPDGDISGESG